MPVLDDFEWVEEPAPEAGADQMLTRTLYLSMDPYQWVRRRSRTEKPGDVCHGRTVSEVLVSNIPDYLPGDFVFNTNGWQTHGLTGEGVSDFGYMFPRKLDPTIAPISTGIGILGMLGLTAYAGLVVQCQPHPGETVVVSAASGGVGQVAGQLAKHRGCRVVGVAGAAKKCQFVVDELGFDACVSHLDANLSDMLASACPDGCDVYFENVGGKVFEAVLPLLNRQARITLCGFISQYGNTTADNPREAWQQTGQAVFDRRDVTVHDLFVGNYVADYQTQFLDEMAGHLKEERVKYREDRWEGLRQAPAAFEAMLTGKNFGKTMVTVADDPTG